VLVLLNIKGWILSFADLLVMSMALSAAVLVVWTLPVRSSSSVELLSLFFSLPPFPFPLHSPDLNLIIIEVNMSMGEVFVPVVAL